MKYIRHTPVRLSVLAFTWFILGGWSGSALARPKTDLVILANGDQVACEIKQLQRGKLQVKTNSMGTIDIEWLDISVLRSGYYFRVETRYGRRYFGTLQMVAGESVLHVIEGPFPQPLKAIDVVEITPIAQSFWSRLDGSLSFGFSFTKSSDVKQLTLDWANLYRTERNLVDLKAKTIITDKGAEEDAKRRVDVSLTYNRLLVRKWSANASGVWQRNDELDLARRFLFSVGAGFSPLKNNRNILRFSAGIALNAERSTGETQTNETGEGVFTASYSLFQYDSPKTDISTSLSFYPSLSSQERYRFDFDVKLRYEVVSDLFLDISYYTNYDSKAPSGEGKKSDYGIVTSIGWSY